MNLTSKGPLFLRISVPEGMDAALEGLAREVLKQQPRDIYWFAAQHFETLVRLRNMGGELR
jgi:Regulatory subunit of type II PKA R-subunit.